MSNFHAGDILPLAELRLGDVVELFDGAYGTATVKQITDEFVLFFRPYAATADFSTTSGVICYTGIEECKYFLYSTARFKIYSRTDLR
jgi:hypothetical protein